MTMTTIWTDEQGHWSAARVLLTLWLIHCGALVWLRMAQLTPMLMTFHGGVATALVTWAAGARIAQYISPIGQQLVNAIPKAPWRKERDAEKGIDPA